MTKADEHTQPEEIGEDPFAGQPTQQTRAESRAVELLTSLERGIWEAELRKQWEREHRSATGRGTRIPKLTPRSAARYIAQVSRAVQLGHLEPKQASTMLYAAQLLIALSKIEQPPENRETTVLAVPQKRTLLGSK